MSCILQMGPLSERVQQRLSGHEVLAYWQSDAETLLAEHAGRIEIMLTSARFGCPASLIERLPRLKAICSFGVGHDAIAVEAARARGIPVSNTPDVLNECVADLAFGLIIDSARQLALGDRFVREGRWAEANLPLGRRVSGKRLGIVGLGRIGEAVAKRHKTLATAMGLKPGRV